MSAATIASTWPAELPDHVSPTQLELLSRCPEAYRRRYLQKERERFSGALALGRATDDAISFNLAQKIATHTDLSETDVVDVFAQSLVDAVDQNGGSGEVSWGESDYNATQATGLGLVKAWHSDRAPSVQPIAVQRKIEYAPASLPVKVVGRSDFETLEATHELKTAARRESKPKPTWWLQAVVYAAENGKRVELEVGVKNKAPYWLTSSDAEGLRVEPVASSIVERLIGTRLRQMHTYFLQYGADEMWPDATLHPWSCGFCGFRPSCGWWEHEREVAA